MARVFIRMVAAIFALAAVTSAAQAQVSCGATITEKVTATADLNCTGFDPGFTINGGSVDLDGHSVAVDPGDTAIALVGTGSKLFNGSISLGAGSDGVFLGGGGVHKVEGIAVNGGAHGFHGTSGKNKLKNCSATGSTARGYYFTSDNVSISRSSAVFCDVGFLMQGDGHKLIENVVDGDDIGSTGIVISGNSSKLNRNIVHGTDSAGILINGTGNKLVQNAVARTEGTGFSITGNANKLTKNFSAENDDEGFAVVGNDNKLAKNVAVDNGVFGVSVITGSGNSVNATVANNNGSAGIAIGLSSGNSLKSNITMGNDTGVAIVGSGTNSVSKTTAVGNTTRDLSDDAASCGTNVWSKNIFNTSIAGIVVGHSCID